MKIGICNELFQGWPIAQIFEYAARLGYGGVEIAPFTLADSVRDISSGKRKEIRRAAEERGIEIIGLHWLLVKPEGLYINHPDPEIRRRTREYLQELIHFCADLGGKILSHGSPKQRTIQEGWNFEEGWKRARETFEDCLPTAEERGVTYCIEPLTRSNTNFINTVEEALRLVEEINHPNFQMLVDCRSAEANEGSAAEAVREALTSGQSRGLGEGPLVVLENLGTAESLDQRPHGVCATVAARLERRPPGSAWPALAPPHSRRGSGAKCRPCAHG